MARTIYYDVTPTSTSGLAANDVIFTATSVGNTIAGRLDSIQCYNLDDYDSGFYLYFLRSNVSVGAANAAMSVSDANADEILTRIEFTSGEYLDFTNSLFQVKDSQDDGMDIWLEAATPSTSPVVYIVGQAKTTGGWSSQGLKFRIGLKPS
jgi:hypothetical protein